MNTLPNNFDQLPNFNLKNEGNSMSTWLLTRAGNISVLHKADQRITKTNRVFHHNAKDAGEGDFQVSTTHELLLTWTPDLLKASQDFMAAVGELKKALALGLDLQEPLDKVARTEGMLDTVFEEIGPQPDLE